MSQLLGNLFSKNRQNYKLPEFYVKNRFIWTIIEQLQIKLLF